MCGDIPSADMKITHFDVRELSYKYYKMLGTKLGIDTELRFESYVALVDKKLSKKSKFIERNTLGDGIITYVAEIANEKLISEFNKSYFEFLNEEEKKDAAKGGEANPGEPESHQEIVYKLLLIGERVAQMFKKSEYAAKQAFAYQQFAINLTIHSIHIGPTKSKNGKIHDIRKIAQKWHQMLGEFN
jgi:hypothetical protein